MRIHAVGRQVNTVVRHVLVIALALITLFPIAWMASTAFRTNREVFHTPPLWIPTEATVEAFASVWRTRPLGTLLTNTAVIASVVTLSATVLAFLAAYGFSRFRFRGKRGFLGFILFGQMLPEILLVVPYFVMMAKVGLVNTRIALILAYTSFALPFCTWMLKGFLDAIPHEIDEAAMIDGCSRVQALAKVVAPLALPGLGVTVLFSLLLSWNHYLFALVLTTDSSKYTFSVGLASFIGEYVTTWNQVTAASLIGILPVVIAAGFLERYLVSGLSAGSVRQ